MTTPFNPVSEARRLGAAAFLGVRDKAGAPYWGHCERVAANAKNKGVEDADALAAALLHDAIEDGVLTWRDLEAFSARTHKLVACLTRDKEGVSYADYIAAIAESADRDLILIKLSDLDDNSDPARLAALPARKAESLKARYESATAVLSMRLAILLEASDLQTENMMNI